MQEGMPHGMPGGMPMQMPGQGHPNATPQQEIESRLTFAFYEIVMVVFVIVFILNCWRGKTSNEGIANRWYEANKKFFEENYAHIGMNAEYNTKAGVPILKESYNAFKFYASGRVFTKWMLVNMDVSCFKF